MPEELAQLDPLLWVAIAVIVIGLVAAAILASRRRRGRTERLRERFGSEYDRTLDRVGSRGDAEAELEEREARRERMRLQPLPQQRRDELRSRWETLQAEFVDAPAAAVRNAEVLLDEVARERGYPDADVEQRLRDLAVDHSDEVDAYRRATGGGPGTGGRREHDGDETALREQFLAIRALLDALLDDGRAAAGPGPSTGGATQGEPDPDDAASSGEASRASFGDATSRDDGGTATDPAEPAPPRSEQRTVLPPPPNDP